MAKRLLVLSVDAMVTEDVDAIRSMPNFRKYLAGGSEFRGGMRTIYPSVTYPIHVSILTGCYAGKHQITSNFKFTTTNRDDNWIWFSDRIAVEDIFTAAKRARPPSRPAPPRHPRLDLPPVGSARSSPPPWRDWPWPEWPAEWPGR